MMGNPRIFMDFSPNSLGNPRIFKDFSPNSLGILRMVPQVSSFVGAKMQGPLLTRGGNWGFGHSPFEQRPARSHIAGGGGRYRYR